MVNFDQSPLALEVDTKPKAIVLRTVCRPGIRREAFADLASFNT